jgi:hypothetical protein
LTTIERTIEAAITSTIAEAIQRPGRRTGTARISSGRAGRCSDSSVLLT